MEVYLGQPNDDFLVRRGAIQVSRNAPYPVPGSYPRVVAPLSDGELDNLVREAFDCNDAENTFRGLIRKAIGCINPNALTSFCAYRIGFEGEDKTEPSLLITVTPGSLTKSESIAAISELYSALER